jgi:ABC-type xylose transport system permease subunit
MGRSGYRTVSGVVFGIVALAQAIRAVMQVPVQLGTTTIPVWVSWVAVVVAGGLCAWAFRSSGEQHAA